MIRVLFVDDEVQVLQAMRRSLHHMRQIWTMEFVASGVEALASLAKLPSDVIVSDMRMPGMDGWQLLAEVKRLYPQTVRLILSGHADPVSIMKSVGTAHQYLAKPCESAELKSAIARTDMLRQLLNSDRLALLVGHVGNLPSVPRAFQEILDCLQRPQASIADAAAIIARDPAMTANVMKLVNSAFFGAPQTIRTVDRAVAYLGLETLCSLVLGHSMFNSDVASLAQRTRLEVLLQHSLDTALTARVVARFEKYTVAESEQAYLAAMLHDVGRLVIVMHPIVAAARTADIDAEIAQMDQHHADVGAYLLGLWAFPSPIVEAVAFHHRPNHDPERPLCLTHIVHFADRLSHFRRDTRRNTDDPGIEPGLLERLGLVDHWQDWLDTLDEFDAETSTS